MKPTRTHPNQHRLLSTHPFAEGEKLWLIVADRLVDVTIESVMGGGLLLRIGEGTSTVMLAWSSIDADTPCLFDKWFKI